MNELSDILSISSSAMQAQSQRLRHVSENIANADTPGYHRKSVAFTQVLNGGPNSPALKVGPVTLDDSPLKTVFDPGHPMADENGYFEGSNVNVMIEVADAREAQRSYEANLKMFDQARQMSSSLLDLLRR